MRVTAIEGHRIWASSYDAGLNPLLALETRHLLERIDEIAGCRFVDLACGTGRWMQLARERGARAAGFDFSTEMLREAARKPGLAGCLGIAELGCLPVSNSAADLTLCSFALGYVASPQRAIAEMARITRTGGRVIVSDLHPCAVEAGWTRSFRVDGEVFEIDHHSHSIATWEAAAASASLVLDWHLDASIGEPEREIFRRAGKEPSFTELSRVPALLAMSWTKA